MTVSDRIRVLVITESEDTAVIYGMGVQADAHSERKLGTMQGFLDRLTQ